MNILNFSDKRIFIEFFKNPKSIWLYFKEQLDSPQILGGAVYANFVVNILIFLHGKEKIENLFTEKKIVKYSAKNLKIRSNITLNLIFYCRKLQNTPTLSTIGSQICLYFFLNEINNLLYYFLNC